MSEEEWLKLKKKTPVRIQWDPDQDVHLKAQISRAIQIGLSGKAVELYVNEWIQNISDVTPLAHDIHELLLKGEIEKAKKLTTLTLNHF